MATTIAQTEQQFELHRGPVAEHAIQSQSAGAQDETPPQAKEASKWVVIAAASAVVFVGVGYTNAFGVFQTYYQTTLFPHKDPSEIILIGSVASSLYMILGAFAGRFADICGYQVSLAIGSILMVGGLFAASVSQEFYQLFLSQGLTFGIGIAFAYLPAVSISRQYFGQSHGLANGVVVSGGALGGCILPYTVRVLLDQRGLSETFRILGYLAAGILCPSVFLLRPKKTSSAGSNKIFELSLFRDQRFVAMMTASTVAMTGFLPRYFLITPSAIQSGVSSTYAAWLLGIMNGLSIIGRVGIGWFADRYGKVTALVSSFVLCGLGHVVFWLPSVLSSGAATVNALFTLFVVYIGLFGSGFVSLLPVVVSHLFGPTDLASKIGLLNSVLGLGVLAGPSAVYAIVSSGQDWSGGIITAGLLMVVGGVAMAGTFHRINQSEQRTMRES